MSNTPLDIADFGDDEPHTPAPGGLAARAMATAEPAYLKGLNAEQRNAVLSIDGPLLVLAGAGTGKTRVLTTRLAHVLTIRKAWPNQILAVTFTNKAAREMKERIGMLIGGMVEGMTWLGTFHSIGVKILRNHAELCGLRSGFSILDQDDQIRLLKQLLEAEYIDEKRWPVRQLANLIDGWKNRGLMPDQVPQAEAYAYGNGLGAQLYKDYQARLKIINAADFGDLLLEPLRMFQENPDVLKEYQQRFKYMLVDEYQDTNIAQYLWLRLLAQGHKNICCVGDDDQSIYGWRGAEVDNILRFEKDFPGAKVVRLEQNYRSTPDILGAASGLISKNEARLGKTLHTTKNETEKIKLRGHWDSEEEARTVGDDIESLYSKGERYADMAILVRASFQTRAFEDRLITLGIPYRLIGNTRFYDRAEIRDANAYFHVILSPDNDLKFSRIINVPKRGIGESSIKKIQSLARDSGMSMYASAYKILESVELPNKARSSLRILLDSISRWKHQLNEIPHTVVAEFVLDESGYTDSLQLDKSPEASTKLENLKELIGYMGEFENLQGFIDHVSLVSDRNNNENQDCVNIMTLHSAKGLEFGTVFLPGWEEGLFPSQRSMDEKGQPGLEEERRLAYVGITRAKLRATISFAQNRQIHGLWKSAIPSRFLDELPPVHVDVVPMTTSYGGYGLGTYGQSRFDDAGSFSKESTYATPGWQRAADRQQRGENLRTSPRFIDGESSIVGAEGVGYAAGERVFHQKFGYGKITSVDTNKLTVDFEKAGEKRVIDTFVERG